MISSLADAHGWKRRATFELVSPVYYYYLPAPVLFTPYYIYPEYYSYPAYPIYPVLPAYPCEPLALAAPSVAVPERPKVQSTNPRPQPKVQVIPQPETQAPRNEPKYDLKPATNLAVPEPAPAPSSNNDTEENPEPRSATFRPAEIPQPEPEERIPPIELPRPNTNSPAPIEVKPETKPDAPAIPEPAKPDLDLKLPTPLGDPTAPPALKLPSGLTDQDKEETSISRSSPVSNQPRVDIFPVADRAGSATSRSINFYNQSGRDIRLTVQGETVILPKENRITATVPARFRWQLADGPEQLGEVPEETAGLEIVIRK